MVNRILSSNTSMIGRGVTDIGGAMGDKNYRAANISKYCIKLKGVTTALWNCSDVARRIQLHRQVTMETRELSVRGELLLKMDPVSSRPRRI